MYIFILYIYIYIFIEKRERIGTIGMYILCIYMLYIDIYLPFHIYIIYILIYMPLFPLELPKTHI